MTTVKDIYDFIDSVAPFASAAQWDNSGLLIGDGTAEVKKAVVALDVTRKEIEQAVLLGAELIVSHHPVIFHPVNSLLKDNAAYEAAKNGLNVICAHTNLDKAPDGVNDTLCRALGMSFEKLPENIGEGFLNVGTLPVCGNSKEIASYISKKLNAAVRYSALSDGLSRFGVCSGSGGDLAADAKAYGCDALITGDASYHDFLDAQSIGVTLFAAGHYETEVIIVPELIKKLSARFADVEFIPSARTNPIFTEK